MRLFLDANVLFSAVRNPNGRTAALIQLAAGGLCELLVSPHCIEETRRNVALKQPDDIADLHRLMGHLERVAECSEASFLWACEQGLPPKDAPILGAAIQARADLLVTGDRTHFGFLYGRTLRGTEIVTPAEALARVLALPGKRR